jgi:hypothetical protein
MSLPRKGKKAVVIRLVLDSDGDFKTEGPMDDPIMFLGMLELGKQRYLSKLTKNEVLQTLQMRAVAHAREAAEAQEKKSGLILPTGLAVPKRD